jgi:hypothetical protein
MEERETSKKLITKIKKTYTQMKNKARVEEEIGEASGRDSSQLGD